MKDSRAPVIVDVLFSIEWFLLTAACIIPFLYLGMSDPSALCMKIVLCSAAYPAVALAMRAEKLTALRFIVPILAVAGCIFAGQTTAERVILGAVGFVSVICGLVVFFRLQRGSQAYLGMMFSSGILIVMAVVTERLEMTPEAADAAITWVAVLSAIYLPLCLATIFLNNLQDALSIFKGRTEQPVNRIRGKMSKVIFFSSILVFFALMMIPQNTGGSLLGGILAGGAFIGVGFFTKLFSVCAKARDFGGTEDMMGMESGMPPTEESPLSSYLIIGFFAIIILAVVVALTVVIFRIIRRAVRGMMGKGDSVNERFAAKYDTVEKIQAAVQTKVSKRTERTNAAKVRRIYRKRITSILGKDKSLRNSLAPSEIARLCKKKGVDVTELTRIYNKARYTLECTDDDLKAAQKL